MPRARSDSRRTGSSAAAARCSAASGRSTISRPVAPRRRSTDSARPSARDSGSPSRTRAASMATGASGRSRAAPTRPRRAQPAAPASSGEPAAAPGAPRRRRSRAARAARRSRAPTSRAGCRAPGPADHSMVRRSRPLDDREPARLAAPCGAPRRTAAHPTFSCPGSWRPCRRPSRRPSSRPPRAPLARVRARMHADAPWGPVEGGTRDPAPGWCAVRTVPDFAVDAFRMRSGNPPRATPPAARRPRRDLEPQAAAGRGRHRPTLGHATRLAAKPSRPRPCGPALPPGSGTVPPP